MSATMASPMREASACMVRRNMPDFTPESDAGATVRNAYTLASQGRRQASLAASRLQSLIYQRPEKTPYLAASAMTWLCGCDLTGGGELPRQPTVQAVIRRLNEALDGHSGVVTKTLLDAPDIERLRLFRQQVRGLLLLSTSAPDRCLEHRPGTSTTAKRACSDGDRTTD